MKQHFRLQNSATQIDNKTWNWEVWVEGSPDEMDMLESVTYILHPTFPNPIKEVKTKRNNFRLKRKGWGEFLIRAKLGFTNGDSQKVEHWLSLDDRLNIAGEKKLQKTSNLPKIFLSYSHHDKSMADTVKEQFIQEGFPVLDTANMSVGDSIEHYIDKAISQSDVVVSLNFDSASNPWMKKEIEKASKQRISIHHLQLLPPEKISPISKQAGNFPGTVHNRVSEFLTFLKNEK